jgi:hypothetical protein
MSALSELTCLGLHRPGPKASRAEEQAFKAEIAAIRTHLDTESAATRYRTWRQGRTQELEVTK